MKKVCSNRGSSELFAILADYRFLECRARAGLESAVRLRRPGARRQRRPWVGIERPRNPSKDKCRLAFGAPQNPGPKHLPAGQIGFHAWYAGETIFDVDPADDRKSSAAIETGDEIDAGSLLACCPASREPCGERCSTPASFNSASCARIREMIVERCINTVP